MVTSFEETFFVENGYCVDDQQDGLKQSEKHGYLSVVEMKFLE